jgi:glycosyltransferase involved in cell wall biosynthesis
MGEYVGACIESILDGHFDAVEVVVVDDGSTDHTENVVKKYMGEGGEKYDPRVVYVYQENAGKSCAVNRGFSVAQGDYLTIVDADDRLPQSSLSARFEANLDENGNRHDLVVGGFGVLGPNGEQGERSAPSTDDPQHLHDRFYLSLKTPFHLNACLFSRELVERTGKLDESLHRCIDGDYALRILKEAKSVNTIDKIVYLYRKHRTSPLERAKYRLKTACYRPRVVWKNYEGWRRWVAVPFGIAMDTGKLFYELVNRFKA